MAKFEAGKSGNPGGRPKAQGEIREIARKHTDGAIKTLVKIMNDSGAAHSARVGAATALLDRAWGRPAQTINANIGGNESHVDDALDALSSSILDRMRLVTTPTEQACQRQIPIYLRNQSN